MAKRIRGGKLTARQKLIAECKAFNKGLSPRLRKSLEEFAAYKYGYVTATYRPIPKEEVVYQREEQHVPSLNSGVLCATKKKEQVYTGEVVIGVGVAHKSNLTPIINKQQAEDLASMRR
jgi:hypothetical protein